MRRLVALALFLLLVLLALYVLGPGLAGGRSGDSQLRIGKVAYATVLTSDEYVLPAQVRVLFFVHLQGASLYAERPSDNGK
jgi:hypothetical protein